MIKKRRSGGMMGKNYITGRRERGRRGKKER